MVNAKAVVGSLIVLSSAVALAVTMAASATSQAPKAPSKTMASAQSTAQTRVSWQDNSTNELGFEIHRGTTGAAGSYGLLATTGANVSSYSDGGLMASTQYCYKIRAFNASGRTTRYSEFSTAACATTLTPPPPPNAPSNPTAVAVSDSRVDVSWLDNSINELGFEVHRGTTGPNGSYSLLATTGINASSYPDGGLTASTQYCYKVRAFDTSGGTTRYSEFSGAACATTLPPPPPPPPGAIQVTVAVSGTCIDPWYFVQIDNQSSGYFNPNVPVTFGVAAGDHSLWLGSVGINCSVEQNPRTVRVTGGATTNVLFAVTCGTGNAITLTGATSGTDLDPDGYGVELWLNWDGHSWLLAGGGSVPANGSMTVCGLYTGQYEVRVTEMATNCSLLTRNPFYVDLSNAGATAALQAACAPIPQLAFVNVADGNPEIYLTSPQGNGAFRLTSNAASDRQPAWSLDAGRVAFTSDRDGNSEIYTMNADGSNAVRLTTDPANDADPAWSPDGTKIAFASDRDGNFEIYAMNADGSNPVRLTFDAAGDREPAWSPDGAKIAFTSDRAGKPDLYVMSSDGSAIARLTNDPLIAAGSADWSPDGTKIAFSGQSCSGPGCAGAIFVMNADGSGVRQLACCDARDPAWSPDGRRIAFTANVSQSSHVAVVAADGTNAVDLLSGSDPSWRRGSTCVQTSPGEICGNGIDDDCNGLVDGADPACIPPVCDCAVDPYGPGCYGEDGVNICNGGA